MTADPVIDVDARRDPALLPGELDRQLLAQAVTFALDSVRAGSAGNSIDLDTPGKLPSGLVWHQASWLEVPGRNADGEVVDHDDDDLAVRPEGCGTACCIAGWIDLAANGLEAGIEHLRASEGLSNSPRIRDSAIRQLFGKEENAAVAGAGTTYYYLTVDLFYGENDLSAVVHQADLLLKQFGLPELELTPEGTFQ